MEGNEGFFPTTAYLSFSMVVEMVPLTGGIGSIFHPPGSARTISGI